MPDSKGRWVGADGSEFTVWIDINSRGLRDREIPYERPAGAARLLALGDSMTAAFQVPLEDTFEKALETTLNRSGRHFEVINAGSNGYGTDNALLFYRHEASRYKPNHVLLMFYVGNDFADNDREFGSPFSNYGKPRFVPDGSELRLVDFPYRVPMRVRLARMVADGTSPLHLAHLTRQPAVTWRASRQHQEQATTTPADDSRRAALWSRSVVVTGRIIRELAREVGAHGSRLLVVLIPPPQSIDPEYWNAAGGRVARSESLTLQRASEQALVAALDKHDIRSLRVETALREAFVRDGRRLYYYVDLHLNAGGHRVVADALHRHLHESGLLADVAADRLEPDPGYRGRHARQTGFAGVPTGSRGISRE